MEKPQATTLLLIDDDTETLAQIQNIFAETEISVLVATSGPAGLRLLYRYHPHLILLSLLIAGMDGWQILAHIRELTEAPVILLSALGSVSDISRGFDAGAADYIVKYIVKPFSTELLLARVRAVLRLAYRPHTKAPIYADVYLALDPNQQRVWVSNVEVKLTTLERKLLFYLFEHADQICIFDQILEHVWGWEYRDSNQYVHVHIARLRRKLEIDPKRPQYLLTEHGVGYQFRRQNQV